MYKELRWFSIHHGIYLYKLETEEESSMALELIKFVKQQLEEFEDSNDDDHGEEEREHNFTIRVALLWTINDFPAYGMLSGWSTAGKKACPYCMENSKAFSLSNGGKVSLFDCHRQFLLEDHPFRRNKNDFIKNRAELSTNLIRHNLDVMHIEKNIFENVFETVMDIEGKTKENVKARDDVKIYCKRKELEKNELTGKYPKACYSLGKEEKKAVCDWVAKLKFPDGYVLNMARCVDMKKYKMFGMKSHDCYVFMQRLIPIVFRELLPMIVWKDLTKLSLFFKDLTFTTIEMDDMIRLQKEIPVILCKLEKIFPPGFFDSMEHLPVLGKLKKKVTNKAKVESSIANAYLIEETSMFCSHYFEPHVKTKMNRVPRNDDGGDEELYEEIKTIELNLIDAQVDTRLEREFANWFNDYAHNS
ncbi:hypothetical protein Tco_1224375, partial [Tanacetum coccineum]